MTHATVILILDAGPADYLQSKSLPFLQGLASGSLRGTLTSPPGFGKRTVLFTGRYPDTSGQLGAFAFDPEGSPYKWTRTLGPLRRLIRPRKYLAPARGAIARITQWASGAHHADPAWIPPNLLPFFRPAEDMKPVHAPNALGPESIFDLCRSHGMRYRYLAHPTGGPDVKTYETLVRELRMGAPYDLYVAQLNTPEQRGQTLDAYASDRHDDHLRELDQRIATVHAALNAGYDTWDLLICGDHGMAPVRQTVDVLSALGSADAQLGTDYVVFVHSTLATLWYLTDKGRRAIDPVLPYVRGSDLVDEEQRARLRIPRGRQGGDRMLAARPGTIFWPDFFHVTDSHIVGMHGHLDKSEETPGMMVLASNNGHGTHGDAGLHPLVDVFPTLCDLLRIPIPQGQEGQSLVTGPAARSPSPPDVFRMRVAADAK